MTFKVSDNIRLFNIFWCCGIGPRPRARQDSLLWQLGWKDNMKSWKRLKTALDYLITIGAVEKCGDTYYRPTDKGIDKYGAPRRKGDGPLSGITYGVTA